MRSFLGGMAIAAANLSWATDAPGSFAQAKQSWQMNKGRKAYQTYAAEFAQFNNSLKLDERGGCYALSKGPVELMLVISPASNGQYAVVGRVLADVDNAKSQCFRRSYEGVSTKRPPFFPFVLQMSMGG